MGNTCCCKNSDPNGIINIEEKKGIEQALEYASKHEQKVVKIQARVRGIISRK